MLDKKGLVTVFIFATVFCCSAEAKLYKWVDDSGKTHYGEEIPSEYASKDKEAANQTGKASKQVVIMSPEMIRVKEEEETRRVLEKKELEEKKRREHALMNTYTSEKEIDQARDRSLALISARIDSNSILLKSSQRAVSDLKIEVETRSREGKKIPQSLADDLRLADEKVARFQLELRKSEDEFSAVKLRFDNDKIQYRKIIVVKPGSTPEKDDYPEYSNTENSNEYQGYSKRAKKSKYRSSY